MRKRESMKLKKVKRRKKRGRTLWVWDKIVANFIMARHELWLHGLDPERGVLLCKA